MTEPLLKRFTRQYMAAQKVPEVSFGWQGGEPTMLGLPFFRRAVELQRLYARKGLRVQNYLQTNGTLLDSDWGAFLRDHGFVVGISIDGPDHLHDAYRVDKKGKGTFSRVAGGLKVLQAFEVAHNVLTCVHQANQDHPLEVYRFLRDELGARFIQLIPVVEPCSASGQDHSVTAESVDAKAFGQFLITIFDEWVRHDVGKVFVQTFDAMLARWVDAPPGVCVFASTCGQALVLEHCGDLYSCDHFVSAQHRLGNINTAPLLELVGKRKQLEFGLSKAQALPEACKVCRWLFACGGDCPKHRLPQGGPPFSRSYLCESYLRFLDHGAPAFDFMARQLAQQRSPARIMAHLAK